MISLTFCRYFVSLCNKYFSFLLCVSMSVWHSCMTCVYIWMSCKYMTFIYVLSLCVCVICILFTMFDGLYDTHFLCPKFAPNISCLVLEVEVMCVCVCVYLNPCISECMPLSPYHSQSQLCILHSFFAWLKFTNNFNSFYFFSLVHTTIFCLFVCLFVIVFLVPNKQTKHQVFIASD